MKKWMFNKLVVTIKKVTFVTTILSAIVFIISLILSNTMSVEELKNVSLIILIISSILFLITYLKILSLRKFLKNKNKVKEEEIVQYFDEN